MNLTLNLQPTVLKQYQCTKLIFMQLSHQLKYSFISLFPVPTPFRLHTVTSSYTHVNKIVQSLYRSGQTLRVPGVWGSQFSRQSAHECGIVFSLRPRTSFSSRKYSRYSCLLGHAVARRWLRHCATSRRVAGSILDVCLWNFLLT